MIVMKTTAIGEANLVFRRKEKSLKPSFSGINSGFYDLDSITQGFQRSDLIIVAGRPSMGKTAFCLNVAINIVKGLKVPVLFFSLEIFERKNKSIQINIIENK